MTVEFVLISFPLFLLLLCMADFGHAFLIKQIITDAAREGARAGAVYQWPAETTIKKEIVNYLSPFDITPDSVTAPLPAGAKTGDSRTVTVQATKTWYVLDLFLTPTQMTATSTMRLE